jgi:hypothetical protein
MKVLEPAKMRLKMLRTQGEVLELIATWKGPECAG